MAAVALVTLGVLACDSNQTGRLAATRIGEVHRSAARGSPVAPLQAACGGDGATTDDGAAVLARAPYLQQVTPSTITVGWRAASAAGQRVEITTPAGRAVAGSPAQVTHATPSYRGAHQIAARVDGLAPDTIYCYAVWTHERPLTARIGFRTAPLAASTRVVRFVAFGDSGNGSRDQYALRDRMLERPFDLIVHTGDLAYEDGTHDEIERHVFTPYHGLMRHIPLFPIPGSHDYATRDAAPYREVFAPPASDGVLSYSYDWGPIHFVALDSEADVTALAAWLAVDLAGTQQPWKIVYIHRPPFSSGFHGSDLAIRRALTPLFEAHGVQLVLSGHEHHYERLAPQHGVHYVITGGGGRGVRGVHPTERTAFAEPVIHFLYVEVDRDQLVVHAIDATGTEFDAVVIAREP